MKCELIICSCQRHGRIKEGNEIHYEFLSKRFARELIRKLSISRSEKKALMEELKKSGLPELSRFGIEEEEIASGTCMVLRANNYTCCPWPKQN